MSTRQYEFIVGPETSTLPAVGTPTASTDLITKGYADTTYTRIANLNHFTDTTESTSTSTGAIITDGGLGVAKNANIGGDLTVSGAIIAAGGTTKINSINLEVKDQNITVNKGGNDTSATGAGVTVERTSTNGSFVFDDTKASKWKVGLLASENEVVDVSSTQTLTNKTLTSPSITSPTGIVKGDVGLGNVDNTSDATKNSAIATLTNKTLTSPVINSPTGIVKADVGLGNVDNTSDASKNSATATLTNKTLTSPIINSPTGIVKADVGLSNVDNTSDASKNSATATLTNKTLTSPIITTPDVDVLSLQEQGSTPANPASGKFKVYPKADKNLYTLNSDGTETKVGAGSGGINYISFGDGESITNWVVSKNTVAGSRPDSGFVTGSTNITWTSSASSPLRGSKSFLLTKDAVNRQGQQAYYPFTIDAADKAKPLQISFDLALNSGTFVGSTTPSTDSDLIVYMYDVTNGTMIEPAGRLIESMVSGNSYRYRSTFQTSATGTTYRLIIHCATTSASAYSVVFDNVVVGPQVMSNGAVITDWTSYTPTITNMGTTSNVNFSWRRVGGVAQIKGYFSSGTMSASAATITIPSGMTSSNTVADLCGSVSTDSVLAANGDLVVFNTASSNLLYFGINSTTLGSFSTARPSNAIFSNNATIVLNAEVPIVGWSSNVQMSNDTDTRVVSFIVNSNAPTASISGSFDTLIFPAGGVVKDTHGGYNATTGKWTVPSSGFYQLEGGIGVAGTSSTGSRTGVALFNNSAVIATKYTVAGGAIVEDYANVSACTYANAGDLLSARGYSTASSPAIMNNAQVNYLHIQKVAGPNQIAASETVAAKYYVSAANSLATATQYAIDCSAKVYDTHNAVTNAGVGPQTTFANGWKFTCPMAGKYQVTWIALVASTNWVIGNFFELGVFKNGGNEKYNYWYAQNTISSGNNIFPQMQITSIVNCVAGDTLQVEARQGSGSTINLNAGSTTSVVEITRVGN